MGQSSGFLDIMLYSCVPVLAYWLTFDLEFNCFVGFEVDACRVKQSGHLYQHQAVHLLHVLGGQVPNLGQPCLVSAQLEVLSYSKAQVTLGVSKTGLYSLLHTVAKHFAMEDENERFLLDLSEQKQGLFDAY